MRSHVTRSHVMRSHVYQRSCSGGRRLKILIAGCGYVGTALGLALVELGHEVWGLRRDPAALPLSFRHVAADLSAPNDLVNLPHDVDYVAYTASAGEPSDAAYKRAYVTGLTNLLAALQGSPVRRVFFTSSTAVYAQADGSWVDESSETLPTHFSGLRTLEAEGLLARQPLPSSILRCAGIYGPGRNRLIDSVRQGKASMSDRFTNRIHRDDIAGIIIHLIQHELDERVLILSDDDPAPQREVVQFLAQQLGVPCPPISAEASGRGGHKRCRNDRLKATGYALKYPSYRQGYTAILNGLA
jgi:nucleoside-diphosphate-sugar epimerase